MPAKTVDFHNVNNLQYAGSTDLIVYSNMQLQVSGEYEENVRNLYIGGTWGYI